MMMKIPDMNVCVENAYCRAGMFSSNGNYGFSGSSGGSGPTPMEIGNFKGHKFRREDELKRNACLSVTKLDVVRGSAEVTRRELENDE